MSKRLLVAVVASAVAIPIALHTVSPLVDAQAVAYNLAWANPGNSVGRVFSFAAAAGAVSALCSASRRIERITLSSSLTVSGALVLVTASFIGVRELIALWVAPELGLLSGVAAGAMAMVVASKWLFPEYDFDAHVRGPELKTSKEVKRDRGHQQDGQLPWGADWIDFYRETVHFLLLGNIGGGKTQFLKMMMAAIARRHGELFIVFDSKPEFIPYLKALGRETIILNPLDKRRTAWRISADIYDETTAQTFVEILIPVHKGADEFWTKAAQGIVVAVIMFLINSGESWGLRDVINICQDPKLLIAAVSQDPKNAIIAQGLTGTNDKSGTNDHMLTVNTYLKKFRPIAALMDSAESTVSLKELIQSDSYGRKTLVLGADEEARATIKTFNALMFEVMVNFILSLSERRDRRIWVLIDELGEASKFVGKNMVRLETKARSKGACVIATTQNYSGLVSGLETDFARQVAELPNHIAVVGGVNGHTAKELSENFFGQSEKVGTSYGHQKERDEDEGVQDGVSNGEEKSSPSFTVESRSLVTKEMLNCASLPTTGPENGLTGFFYGSEGGPHWHRYTWREVKDMQVEDLDGIAAYERVGRGYPGMELKSFSEDELTKWFDFVESDGGTLEERYRDVMDDDC